MQRILFGAVIGIAFSWCLPALSLDTLPGPTVDVARVELAYRQGLSSADSQGEQSEAAAVRAESLRSILDTSYQATLAWLLDGNGRLTQVLQEQAAWQDERDELLGVARTSAAPASREALDLASTMTLDRIERLTRLATSDADTH